MRAAEEDASVESPLRRAGHRMMIFFLPTTQQHLYSFSTYLLSYAILMESGT